MSNPSQTESARWEAALEHYQWDRLDEAFELIFDQGVGEAGRLIQHYRLIEAEAITRRKGVVRRVNEWLTVEYIPDEIMGLATDLADRVVRGCDDIANRLSWRHARLTRFAILAEETDADWATFPFGYCSAKEPYEKICLPNYLLDDKEEFHRAVAHEYGHVISNNLSDGNAPRWLEEAISVLAEGTIDREIAAEFRTRRSPWLGPDELERVLESRGRDEAELEKTLRAYQQCAWIGRYLSSIGGDEKLRRMLVEHANDRVLSILKLRFLGRDRVDGAMRTVYSLSLKRVFGNAHEFLMSS